MTGLVRKAMLLAVCGLLTAGAAMAHVPDPANSDCINTGAAVTGQQNSSLKAIVFVCGNNGGTTPDPASAFRVIVRDFNNVPLENSSVVLDFGACDVQLCTNQLDPNVIVDCVSQTVRKLTDVNGIADFKVMGKAKNAGLTNAPGAPGCLLPNKNCFRILADGVELCTGDAPIIDLVSQAGEDGLNSNDLSKFLQLWLVCGNSPLRGNYSIENQVIDSNDLSQWLKLWLVFAGSNGNCAGSKGPGGPKCP